MGDIGWLFPDNDPRWKDADSLQLLAEAVARAAAAGFRVVNVDVVVIAERPTRRTSAAMASNLARRARDDVGAVSVKGKTNEGVDATGRGEAIVVARGRAAGAAGSRRTDVVAGGYEAPGLVHPGVLRMILHTMRVTIRTQPDRSPSRWQCANRAVQLAAGPRAAGGTFILRIEDTDAERSTAESEARHPRGPALARPDWDEGPDVGRAARPLPPVRAARDATAGTRTDCSTAGRAYYCSAVRNSSRDRPAGAGPPASSRAYPGRCRAVDPADAAARVAGREPAAIRFFVPPGPDVVFTDLVRGEVRFSRERPGRSGHRALRGRPAYNFAVVVDDALME